MEMTVLFANLETPPKFTGNSIPFNVLSNSFYHCLYSDTLDEFVSAVCKAERTDHRKHLLSSFFTYIIVYLLAKTFGTGMYEAPLSGLYLFILNSIFKILLRIH